MRRELKGYETDHPNPFIRVYVAKHIPMRRELKGSSVRQENDFSWMVAKHIPMRRELKDLENALIKTVSVYGRKAHPDEKGTERLVAYCDLLIFGGWSQSTSR